jgi:DNA-binding transcriptional LysR family regulator
MSIDQLRLLSIDDLVILKYLSESQLGVTAIAGKMQLSQPAITQRIRKMEDIYRDKILSRKGRGVELTPFGIVLATRASAALGALDPLVPQSQSPISEP